MSLLKFGQWHKHYQWDDVVLRRLDGDGYQWHTQYRQDVEPCIDHNTKVRNETNGWLPDRSARKVGSIPVTVVYDKIREWERTGELKRGEAGYGMRLNQKLKELLKDRDYAKFRTTEKV